MIGKSHRRATAEGERVGTRDDASQSLGEAARAIDGDAACAEGAGCAEHYRALIDDRAARVGIGAAQGQGGSRVVVRDIDNQADRTCAWGIVRDCRTDHCGACVIVVWRDMQVKVASCTHGATGDGAIVDGHRGGIGINGNDHTTALNAECIGSEIENRGSSLADIQSVDDGIGCKCRGAARERLADVICGQRAGVQAATCVVGEANSIQAAETVGGVVAEEFPITDRPWPNNVIGQGRSCAGDADVGNTAKRAQHALVVQTQGGGRTDRAGDGVEGENRGVDAGAACGVEDGVKAVGEDNGTECFCGVCLGAAIERDVTALHGDRGKAHAVCVIEQTRVG